MRLAENKLLVLVVAALVWLVAAAADEQPAATADPFVLLDAAKLQLGEGRLAKAKDLLAEIPLDGAESYVSEEIIFQRLLVVSAYLTATHSLVGDLQSDELADSAYGQWLADERDGYAASFARLAQQFLERTATEPRLDFVRFRLPVVTAEHINDLELFSDPEILGPAVTNWDDGREGLGKGLIAGQARVALVLAAARFYDLPQAAPSLEQVRQRLTSGVPLDYPEVLAWIADEAEQVPDNSELAAVAVAARERASHNPAPLRRPRSQPEATDPAQNTAGAETSE